MFKNTIQFRVEWGETDTAGIIFYPNYYRWFDRGTHELFRAAGIPISQLLQEGYAQPIIECGCRFAEPLYYDDLVTLESSITEVRTRTFRLEHTARRSEVVTGSGFEVRAWIKLGEKDTNGRLATVAIPAEYAEKLKS